MRVIETIVRSMDSISEMSGKIARWACMALVLVLFTEVVLRHVFIAPTMWAHDTARMLLATIATMGLAYTHRHDGHVRIDLLYRRLSPRGKAVLNVVCALLLFFPVVIIFVYAGYHALIASWIRGEVLGGSFWYPPAWPIRTVVFVGFCLFLLQGVANFTRDLYTLARGEFER